MTTLSNAHFGLDFRPCEDHSPAKEMGGAHGPMGPWTHGPNGPMRPMGPWAPILYYVILFYIILYCIVLYYIILSSPY